MCFLQRATCRLTAGVCRPRMPLNRAGAVGARAAYSCALCLRLQRGGGVLGWGRACLGTGAQARGARGGEPGIRAGAASP
jgi:hypothetical protein